MKIKVWTPYSCTTKSVWSGRTIVFPYQSRLRPHRERCAVRDNIRNWGNQECYVGTSSIIMLGGKCLLLCLRSSPLGATRSDVPVIVHTPSANDVFHWGQTTQCPETWTSIPQSHCREGVRETRRRVVRVHRTRTPLPRVGPSRPIVPARGPVVSSRVYENEFLSVFTKVLFWSW